MNEHRETYNPKTGWVECEICGKIIKKENG